MKYFGYYADDRNNKNVNCAPSAINKMHYISKQIANVEGKTEIISAVSPIQGSQISECYELEQGISVRYFEASYSSYKIISIIKRVLHKARLFNWAYKNINQGEKVIVYHSLGYMRLFKLLKKIKNFSLILEVEEIYADVLNNQKIRKKELEFANLADAYIFPTELLDEFINKEHKPSVIIYGSYQVEKNRNCNIFQENLNNEPDDVIHCVYAGTLDPRKGGAVATAAAAVYLPGNYHVHILGFGSNQQIIDMKSLIKDISKRTKAKITYDGLLTGEDYIRFIQSCDIGLSTQDPTAAFNTTSFPSKILSYLANGLRVVSINIPVIEQSAVGDMLYYYTEQNPEQIANAIKSVNIDGDYDSRGRVSKLASNFEQDLRTLLEDY